MVSAMALIVCTASRAWASVFVNSACRRHRCRRRCLRPIPPPPPVQIEKERLQGQVVTSPQRILREVADQQQALDQVIFMLLLMLLLLSL